jgi:hypothetical protein
MSAYIARTNLSTFPVLYAIFIFQITKYKATEITSVLQIAGKKRRDV